MVQHTLFTRIILLQSLDVDQDSGDKVRLLDVAGPDPLGPHLVVVLVVGEGHDPLAGAAPGAVVRAGGRGGGGAGGGVVAGIPTQWW